MYGINGRLKGIFEHVLDMLYPGNVTCIFCDQEALVDDMGVCNECAHSLILVESCKNTLKHAPELDGIKATFRYTGVVAEAVKRYKYGKRAYLGRPFSRFMEIDPNWQIDFAAPVPLHPKRQRKRGYNQCTLLAQGVCERYNLQLNESALKRIVNTKKQARKSTDERAQNVSCAFLADTAQCNGKNILIIDDVCTTGSTLRECAKELKAKGANKVYALVLCHSRDKEQ